MNSSAVTLFRNDLLDEVLIHAEANNELRYISFVTVFTDYLAEAGFINDFSITPYRRPFKAGRRNARVDGYSENLFEETMSLVIADYCGEPEAVTLTKTDALQTFKECMSFVEESFKDNLRKEIDKSDPAYYLSTVLLKAKKNNDVRKIKVFLISDKIISRAVKNIPSQSIDGVAIEFAVWTVDRLFENIKDEGETRDIVFEDYGGKPIKCLYIDSEIYPGYMCAMPGELLANLYEKLDTALLEGNIRSFLSTKVAVNSGIRRTIVNEPDHFFVYNNGISATASDVHTTTEDGQVYLTGIVDFQIVNGGQTTASLYNSRYKDKADLSDISVPMKLTIVEKEKSKEVIPLIAEYANTQNRVNAADFFSNHEFCIKMERYSRTCRVQAQDGAQYDTFWFFERAKGQYTQAQLGKTPAQIKEFRLKYPKTQLFTKTDLAKFRNSWSGMPDTVSKGAQTNFQKFADEIKAHYESRADEYNEKYYKETVSLGILFHAIESLVSNQDWYQQGYRAQIVTYSIAVFSKLFNKQYPKYNIDFLRIWQEQRIPSVILDEFVEITRMVNDAINDPTRGTVNVTQWCKRAECWKRVQESINYLLNEKVLEHCISRDEELTEKAHARKEIKVDKGIQAETDVVNYGAENWSRLNGFLMERKITLSSDQTKALAMAMKLPYKIPNSYQSKLLVELRERALDEGFKL